MKTYSVSYSFTTKSGDIAHHSAQSGPANSKDHAVSIVLQYATQFVRDNLVSASAAEHLLNKNGDCVRPSGFRI